MTEVIAHRPKVKAVALLPSIRTLLIWNNYMYPQKTSMKFSGLSMSLLQQFCLRCFTTPPPKIGRQSEYATYISDTLVQLLSVYGDAIIIICGDFNDFDFSCVAEDFGLTDLYHGSTRGGHQLDHVYCSSAQYDGSSFKTLLKSDHLAIIASPRVSLPVAKSLVSFRDQRPRNQDLFNRAMDICDFSYIDQIEDRNVALSQLFDDLNILIDQFCPIRTVKLSTKDPFYIRPLVKFLLKKRNKLFRKRNFRRA